MAGVTRRRRQGRGSAPGRVPDAPHAGERRRPGIALPTLLETDYLNTIPTAAEPELPGRRGDGAPHHRVEPLERGGHGHPRQQAGPRRPHRHLRLRGLALRDGLPALLPRQGRPGRPPAATSSTSRATPPPASTPARSSTAGSPRRHLDHFRQEAGGDGLPSYPHPRRLPWLWEFPTVSMGLGPLSAIYQARFNRYLEHRGIKDTSGLARVGVPRRRRDGRAGVDRRPGTCRPRGPGQPDLRHQLQPAAPRRPGPPQLQDRAGAGGPVPRRRLERGQGAVGRRLGRAAGRLDTDGALLRRLREVPDAQFQTYATRDAAYVREHFFGADPALRAIADPAHRRQAAGAASTPRAPATSRARCTPPTGPPSSTRARRR